MSDLRTPFVLPDGFRPEAADADRLRDALDHLTLHPDRWTQTVYLFEVGRGPGSRDAACLAGRVVLQAGAVPCWRRAGGEVRTAAQVDYVTEHGARTWSVPTLASRLLDVTTSLGDVLFAPERTLRQLWHLAAEVTGGRVEVPSAWPPWADALQGTRLDVPYWWSPAGPWIGRESEGRGR